MGCLRIALAAVVVSGVAAAAPAQDARGSRTPDPGAPRVLSGQTVWVITADGREIKGRVGDVSAARIDLVELDLSGQEHTTSLPLGDIARIDARDSARNGAIIGAIPVAVLYGWLAADVSQPSANCYPTPSCQTKSIIVPAVAGAALGLAVGAGLGTLIDRAIPGRRVVYRSPRSATVAVAPAFGGHTVGGVVALRW